MLQQAIADHIAVFHTLSSMDAPLRRASTMCVEAIRGGGKVMFAGNGGSAADAQHLAAELIGRLVNDRRALPGLALTTDSSGLTCVGNDYGFEEVFSRQIEGLGKAGDVLVAISTSGNSRNVIRAVASCKAHGVHTIGFLGRDGGALASQVDIPLVVGSNKTARVQEAHIFLGHLLCHMIESDLGLA